MVRFFEEPNDLQCPRLSTASVLKKAVINAFSSSGRGLR